MSYEAWRISFQSSEAAARAAYAQCCQAQDEAESLRKDAARMDYLTSNDETYRILIQSQPSGDYVFDSCVVSGLREAIDKAMQGGG